MEQRLAAIERRVGYKANLEADLPTKGLSKDQRAKMLMMNLGSETRAMIEKKAGELKPGETMADVVEGVPVKITREESPEGHIEYSLTVDHDGWDRVQAN